MSLKTRRSDHVSVTTDAGGQVWYAEGRYPPISSGLDVTGFCGHRVLDGARTVRLHGGLQHARLVLALCELADAGIIHRLQVCSPSLCDAYTAGSPRDLLVRLRKIVQRPSLGGWHDVTMADRCALGLAVYEQEKIEGDGWVRLLGCHPVAMPAAFVPGLEPRRLARLMGHVLDPRYFVDPAAPDRSSRLQSWLGLTESVVSRVLSGRPLVSPASQRCDNLVRLWFHGCEPVNPGPREFHWRVYRHRQGGVRGVMAATRWLLDYLRSTWLDRLESSHQGHLFVPEYFFGRADEAEAYTRHLTV